MNIPPIPPLPEKVYDTQMILFDSVQSHARSNGSAVSKRRTKRKNGVPYKLYIKCDWGGVYKSKISAGNLQRKTGTRLQDCPFPVVQTFAGRAWYSWKLYIKGKSGG